VASILLLIVQRKSWKEGGRETKEEGKQQLPAPVRKGKGLGRKRKRRRRTLSLRAKREKEGRSPQPQHFVEKEKGKEEACPHYHVQGGKEKVAAVNLNALGG